MTRLTAYELACGCVRSQYVGRVNITLWMEHGTYHVRAHDHGNSKRLWWDSYTTVFAAHRRFEHGVKLLKLLRPSPEHEGTTVRGTGSATVIIEQKG